MKEHSPVALHKKQKLRSMVAFLAGVLMFFSAGCAVVREELVIEEPFKDEQTRLIRNGVTTKKEVLQWFGPPAAMISIDEAFPVADQDTACSPAAVSGFIRRPDPVPGPERKRVDRVPQRLLDNKPPDGTIYCYSGYKYTWADICFDSGCYRSTPVLNLKKLWLLIDNNGTVIDHELELPRQEEETRKEQQGSLFVDPGLRG